MTKKSSGARNRFPKIVTLEEKVENILSEDPLARENDTILYALFVSANYKGILDADVRTFMDKVDTGVVPSLPTIQRIRRSIQREKTDLGRTNINPKPKLRDAIPFPCD